ncbi:putative secreted protein (Por secretion system target) [Flavobacteriaceae bacterium MAR_2010_105]|nr:putative secreted protein (Por secretion system target) [Flavobacteriaceae bacterium MAR_2010_105]
MKNRYDFLKTRCNKFKIINLCLFMKTFLLSILVVLTLNLYAQPSQTYSQHFNGNQIFLSSNTSTLNLGSSFTIEAWVYINEAAPYAVIAGKVFNPRGNDPFQNYVLALDGTGLKPEFVQTTGISGSYTAATAASNVPLNTWTHLAATLGSGTMQLFVNGTLVASQSSPGAPAASPGVPFSIGSGATPSFQTTCCGIKGIIKHVRVWDVAKTGSEINANKDISLTGSEANLLAYYPMNESSGQSLTDLSPNNNHLLRGITSGAEGEDPTPYLEANLEPIFSYTTITLPSISTAYEELYVVDFNADNKLDFLVSSLQWPPTDPATTTPLQAYENNGALSFSATNPFIGSNAVVHPRDFAVGDFNSDGKADIFIADHGTDVNPFPGIANKLFLQNASGQLVDTPSNIPSSGDFSHHTASADIDNDGDIDIYVCNIWGQNLIGPYFLINDGSGNFTTVNTNIPANIADLTDIYMSSRFADIDKDNDMDLILGAVDGAGIAKDLILLNNGAGVFTPGLALPDRYGSPIWGTVSIVTADFNNDTYPDLLMSTLQGYQTCHLQLLLNNQDGTFTDATSNIPQSWGTSNTWIKWIEAGDFNSDGKIDIVGATHFGGSPKLYYNSGNAHFVDASDRLSLPGVSNIISTRVRDFDNDGKLDIAFLAPNNRIVIAKSIQDFTLNNTNRIFNETEGPIVYPNPFKNRFSIKLKPSETLKSIQIYNVQGEKVYSTDTINEDISVNFLPSGIYFLNIETTTATFSKKLIKA